MFRLILLAQRPLLILLYAVLWPDTPAPEPPQDPQAASFVDAARRGDLDAVNAALAAGVDVNATIASKWTALHAAAERSRVDVLKRLIEAGANVNAKEYLQVTPLHWAAIRGPREAVKALIEAGADVNAHCVQHHTPLGSAAGTGNAETAKLLIESGADVNGGQSMTPLILAARDGHAPMIKLLVEHGAKVNDPNNPPLHWAGTPEAAKALLAAGAQVNLRDKDGQTALHLTRRPLVSNADTVKLLIDAQADVNAKSPTGSTPLHEAVRLNRLDIVKLLIAAGADTEAKDQEADTPLSLARQVDESFVAVLTAAGARDDGRTDLQRAVGDGDLQRVRELIAEGADVNQTGPGRITATHVASELGHADILTELIEAGAKVDQRDIYGYRPLHRAADAVVAERLLAAGAKVGEPTVNKLLEDSPPPPIYVAAIAGRADVVHSLISHKAKLNPRHEPPPLVWATFFGRTKVVQVLLEGGAETESKVWLADASALHVAANGSFAGMHCPEHVTPEIRLEIVKLLLDNGADVNAAPESLSGYTALHAAAEAGHANMVELLLQRKASTNALTGTTNFKGVHTPLDLAKTSEVRALLLQHGGKPASELKTGERRPR